MHGVVVSEMTMEMTMAVESVTANSRKRRPTMPPIMRMGIKTAISDMLMEKTVKPISCAPLSAAAKGSMPASRWRVMFSMTTMASSTTNPVAMVKRHQRQVVERVAEQIHHGEGSDERNRDGDAGNERGARAAQKQEDHQNDQANGEDQRLFDGEDGGANGDGAVQNDRGFDSLRKHGLEKRQLRLDAVDGLNNVGAGLAEDGDDDRPASVHISGGAEILRRVHDIGDIGEADGFAIVVTDDQGPIVGSLGDLVVGNDVFADAIVGKLAPRLMGVLQAKHRLHAAEREAKALQLGGIDLDAHRRRGAALDAHLPDALNLRKLLLQDRSMQGRRPS